MTFHEQQKQLAKERFENKCPPLYRQTDPALLPCQDASKFCFQNWPAGTKGLYMLGPTRTGKTRTAWHIIKNYIAHNFCNFDFYDGLGWATSVARYFGSCDETEGWLKRVSKIDLLFLDDLFKSKITEAQELAIYGILERRTANLLPTIITSNLAGKDMMERSVQGAHRMLPIIHRLKEFFIVVEFPTLKGSQKQEDTK